MKTPSKGFTLIEVMIGTVLLSLILAGGLAALIHGYRTIESARDVTRVSQIIQSEIEAIRTHNWEQLSNMPEQKTQVPLHGSFAARFAERYTVYREVVPNSDTQKSIIVTVEWTAPNGVQRQQRNYTRVTKGGLNDYFYRTF